MTTGELNDRAASDAESSENARVKATKNAIPVGFIVAFPCFVFLLFQRAVGSNIGA